MSTMSKISDIIYQELRSNSTCRVKQFEQKVIAEGIAINKNSTLIRGTLYKMMDKDPRIERIGRGTYRFVAEKTINEEGESNTMENQDQVIAYLAESKERLRVIIEKLRGVKWYSESDENVELYRRRGAAVLNYYDDVSKMVAKLQA